MTLCSHCHERERMLHHSWCVDCKRQADRSRYARDYPRGGAFSRGQVVATYGESAAARKARADKLMAAVPLDLRSLTGRVCGDPLPGRSALERRGRA